MKYRSLRRWMAAALSTAVVVSMAACGNEQQVSKEETQKVPKEETQQEAPKEDTQKEVPQESGAKEEITVAADAAAEPTVNGLEDGLCSWKTGGTEAGTVNGDDYSFTPAIYINGGEVRSAELCCGGCGECDRHGAGQCHTYGGEGGRERNYCKQLGLHDRGFCDQSECTGG